jgi:hypothetical protein
MWPQSRTGRPSSFSGAVDTGVSGLAPCSGLAGVCSVLILAENDLYLMGKNRLSACLMNE